jgi:hypothetical protein
MQDTTTENNNPMSQGMNPNMIKNAEDLKCEKCEKIFFTPTVIIKKISALISPTGKEILAPIQMFQCASCGHVNESFLDAIK